jgi:hypothetical protein
LGWRKKKGGFLLFHVWLDFLGPRFGLQFFPGWSKCLLIAIALTFLTE